MASVSSLDKDLRRLRADKYTPAAANEARAWIEEVLGEKLSGGDLLESLKDGVALCKLVNLVGSPGVKFKQSAMPFVQMENISHFLRACKSPPLNLQEHDVFLTVDLFEQKDPAQVLQCLGAFSRAAQRVNPSKFSSSIGPKSRAALTPQTTGPSPTRARGLSNVSNSNRPTIVTTGDSGPGGRWSPTKGPARSPAKSPAKSPPIDRVGSPGVSSWSKRDHEGVTSPAWNIAQYGYMGGASQGNLGIAFGGRRQITAASPLVPNVAEKERRRKEQEAEAERQRQQMEEEERRRRAEQEADEERARKEEERRWEEETRRQHEEERRKADEEKRRWEEEERQWRETNEKRRKEEEEAEARLAEERRKTRSRANSQLKGQFLSQYQAENGISPKKPSIGGGYSDRVKELERELELARQREREYEEERERRGRGDAAAKSRQRSRSRPKTSSRPPSRQDSYVRGEREVLRTQWDRHQEEMGKEAPAPTLPARPLPDPKAIAPQRTGEAPSLPLRPQRTGESRPLPLPGSWPSPQRPLPNPSAAAAQSPAKTIQSPAKTTLSPAKTKAGGFASKSLLEREMEMERQRQRDWEEAQKETASRVAAGDGVEGIGGGIGGRWDVSQWGGFTGGDNQNKGGAGIGAGRRQIVGPRPLPGRP